jgi:hypothetical protein
MRVNDRLILTTIVETLGRSGALTVDSLYKRVKKLHGDPGSKFFNDILITLELQGLIAVYGMSGDKRRVELVRRER